MASVMDGMESYWLPNTSEWRRRHKSAAPFRRLFSNRMSCWSHRRDFVNHGQSV